ncbi:MAG: hypothetical protein GYA12_08270 [Chloroflexi bacterium]|nr:hypothetical protein [Chloroflexota bacterium]BCY16282.1 hypothetical protein hrd7_01310 [Leptolinea sp. HRD-7]
MNDYLIPVMVVAIIVVINIALWTSLSGKKAVKNSARWTQISQSIQKPFEKEDMLLKELSERVNRLKQKSENGTESETNDQSIS